MDVIKQVTGEDNKNAEGCTPLFLNTVLTSEDKLNQLHMLSHGY
jgi:hypothetical protein